MTRYKSGLPTMSLGHGAAGYSMRDKIAAIADIGFNGVEVSIFVSSADVTSITLPERFLRSFTAAWKLSPRSCTVTNRAKL
jgi:hypothetical protein